MFSNEHHSSQTASLRFQEVRVMVMEALKLFSQDRTGLADYALESGGRERTLVYRFVQFVRTDFGSFICVPYKPRAESRHWVFINRLTCVCVRSSCRGQHPQHSLLRDLRDEGRPAELIRVSSLVFLPVSSNRDPGNAPVEPTHCKR